MKNLLKNIGAWKNCLNIVNSLEEVEGSTLHLADDYLCFTFNYTDNVYNWEASLGNVKENRKFLATYRSEGKTGILASLERKNSSLRWMLWEAEAEEEE